MDDGATVPLFYEKRVPKVLIQNENLSEEFVEIVEDENLDDAQQERLEKKFAQEVEVIKREDRLETIAKDIVYHFPRRGYLGKGMVVSLDKFTAVKVYDKVQDFGRNSSSSFEAKLSSHRARRKKEIAKAGGLHPVGADGCDRKRGSGGGKEIREAKAHHQTTPRTDE